MASTLLVILAFLMMALSSIPLTASIVLIYLLGQLMTAKQVLLPALQGEIEFHSAASYTLSQQVYQIESVSFIGAAFGLLIRCSGNQRYILWRDSLPEADYRHLIVMLQKEH